MTAPAPAFRPLRGVLVVPDRDLERVASLIEGMEPVRVLEPQASEGPEGSAGEGAATGRRHARWARRVGELMEGLGLDEEPQGAGGSLPPGLEVDELLREIEEAVSGWRERRDEARERARRLEALVRGVRWLERAGVSGPLPWDPSFMHIVLATVPVESLDRLELLLFRDPAVVVPLAEREREVLILAAGPSASAPVLDQALDAVEADLLTIPELEEGEAADPGATLSKLEEELHDARDRVRRVELERKALAARRAPRLMALRRRIRTLGSVARGSRSHGGEDGFTALGIECPPESRKTLLAGLEQASDGRCVVLFRPVDEKGRGAPLPDGSAGASGGEG